MKKIHSKKFFNKFVHCTIEVHYVKNKVSTEAMSFALKKIKNFKLDLKAIGVNDYSTLEGLYVYMHFEDEIKADKPLKEIELFCKKKNLTFVKGYAEDC